MEELKVGDKVKTTVAYYNIYNCDIYGIVSNINNHKSFGKYPLIHIITGDKKNISINRTWLKLINRPSELSKGMTK